MNTFVIDGVKFKRTGVSVRQKLIDLARKSTRNGNSCRHLVGAGRACKRPRALCSFFCKKHTKIYAADSRKPRTMKQVIDVLSGIGFVDRIRKKNGLYWFTFKKKFWRPSYIRSMSATAGEWFVTAMLASEFSDKPVFCPGCCTFVDTRNGKTGKFGAKCRCHGQPLYLCDRCRKKHEKEGTCPIPSLK